MFIAGFVFFLLGCFLAPMPAHAPAYAEGPRDFSPQEIIGHIRFLASDELEGRRAGEEGGKRAARYIVENFQGMGLEPVGDNGSYEQRFEFTYGVRLGDENSLSFETGGGGVDLALGEDFHPLGISSSGRVEGGVVFAGYGISAPEQGHDDYEGIEVAGRAVVVLRFTPEGADPKSPLYEYAPLIRKAKTAKEKGAGAIIFVTPSYEKEPENLRDYAFKSGYRDMGIPAVVLRRRIAERLLEREGRSLPNVEKELKPGVPKSFPLPASSVEMTLSLERNTSQTSNVLGLVEPQSPEASGGVVVIGAHYDHIGYGGRSSRMDGSHGGEWVGEEEEGKIHNGADDNASGVAGLLELARHFSSRREHLERRVLFIAFGAEELGVLGSTHYVKDPALPLSETVAMINMDMIGRLRGDRVMVLGMGSSLEWGDIIQRANEGVGLDVGTGQSGFAPSDQTAFLSKGIPSIQFFTGIHSEYHTPEDDWEKINAEGEARVLRLVQRVIEQLAEGEGSLTYVASEEGERGFMGFSVYLGTIPDYSSGAEGVRLMGVKPGSPAEKGGLRGNDVIIGYEGRGIEDIYDLVYALGDSKPGAPVEITVKRGGENLVLSVVPEARETGE